MVTFRQLLTSSAQEYQHQNQLPTLYFQEMVHYGTTYVMALSLVIILSVSNNIIFYHFNLHLNFTVVPSRLRGVITKMMVPKPEQRPNVEQIILLNSVKKAIEERGQKLRTNYYVNCVFFLYFRMLILTKLISRLSGEPKIQTIMHLHRLPCA